MDSFLYDFPTALIVSVLFVFIAVGIELGYRLGGRAKELMIQHRTRSRTSEIRRCSLGKCDMRNCLHARLAAGHCPHSAAGGFGQITSSSPVATNSY